MRPILVALLVGGVLTLRVGAAEPTPLKKQWQVEGQTRDGLIYAPASATQTATPVVFAFHGHGGSAAQAARSFTLHTHWPEAIVVYLQGLNTPGKLSDPTGKRPGWQHGQGDQADRDLKFFDAVLAALKSDYRVDPKRIYATGHSNGGAFTYLLWAARHEVFAAVAPSGAVPGAEAKNLKPKPVLHVAGETDPLVKYEWQKRTLGRLRTLNGCEPAGASWNKVGDLVGTAYTSKAGPPVVTLIHPGGHQYPKAASKLMVQFFQEPVRP